MNNMEQLALVVVILIVMGIRRLWLETPKQIEKANRAYRIEREDKRDGY